MELVKNKMSTNITKTYKVLQITLEEDLNVPDTKQDVDKIIETKGEIFVQEVEPMVDKVQVNGELYFRVLYAAPGGRLSSFSHHFPFEELIYMDGILPSDSVKVQGVLDDLNVTVINSRKLEIRSLIGLTVRAMDAEYIEGAVDIEDADGIQTLHKPCSITGLVVNKKDMMRLKEEVTIPANKPNVADVLWDSVTLKNQEIRLLDEKISLKGELLLFVLYQGEEEGMPFQNLEWELPFETEIECRDCQDHMIGNINVAIGSTQIDIKPDADGEERILALDASLDLDIRIYEEKEMNFMQDAYAPTQNITMETAKFPYESLIIKNNSKTKVNQRIRMKENQGKLLQICHVEGEIKIDDMECTEDGIQVDGVIAVDLIYVSGDDRYPINCLSTMIPFSHLVEAKGVKEDDHYEIMGNVEAISAIMLDANEIEVRANLLLDVIAFAAKEGNAVIGIDIQPFEEELFEELPGIVGYVVQQDDSLWDIAKRFYTTVDQIRLVNEIEEEEAAPGTRLIIVKEVRDAALA